VVQHQALAPGGALPDLPLFGLQGYRIEQVVAGAQFHLEPAKLQAAIRVQSRQCIHHLVNAGLDALTQLTGDARCRRAADDYLRFYLDLRPAPPSILFVAISQKDIRRGQPLAVCYGVKQAVKVRLDPGGVSLPPMEKSCIQFYPARPTAYTLVATGEDGRTDREQFTVGVK